MVGILNTSPDSFSGDGLEDVEAALRRAVSMASEGADIIDIGGESTRPGYRPVDALEELRRTAGIVSRVVSELPETPVSIDTSKLEVARAAFDSGATVLNDGYGLRGDAGLARLAAGRASAVIAMHNQRGRSAAVDAVSAVRAGLSESLRIAVGAGVPVERMILDPGFGFGWELSENAEILRRLGELRELGCPLLVGTSRKRMTGAQHGWEVDERLPGSAATTALAIANGADLVRVHDVAQMSRVARIADDMVRGV